MLVRAHARARVRLHARTYARKYTHWDPHLEMHTDAERASPGGRATWSGVRNNLQSINHHVHPPTPLRKIFEQSLQLIGVVLIDGALEMVDDLRAPCCF